MSIPSLCRFLSFPRTKTVILVVLEYIRLWFPKGVGVVFGMKGKLMCSYFPGQVSVCSKLVYDPSSLLLLVYPPNVMFSFMFLYPCWGRSNLCYVFTCTFFHSNLFVFAFPLLLRNSRGNLRWRKSQGVQNLDKYKDAG